MYTWILVFFTVFLKNRNVSSKIKRSKVTDYAALNEKSYNKTVIDFNSGRHKDLYLPLNEIFTSA